MSPFNHPSRLWLVVVLMAVFTFLPAQIHLPEPTLFTSTEFERIDRIEQDEHGLVWLATNHGLFCFDGTFFRKVVHSPEGGSSVDNGQINNIFLDMVAEKLWLATPDGASVLDLKTEIFSDYTFCQNDNSDLADGECTAIMKDRQGNIWLGIVDFGLVRFDSAFHYFPIKENAVDDEPKYEYGTVFQIAQDVMEDSTLWLATGSTGLVGFNSNTGAYLFPDQSAIENIPGGVIFTTLFVTNEKIILGNTWNERSYIYDLTSRSFRELKNNNPDFRREPVRFSNIQYRSPATFWVHTGIGLSIFDIQKDSLLQWFPKPEDQKSFSDGFLASPERIWVGSEKGLLLYDFSTYKIENHVFRKGGTENSFTVTSVLEKEEGMGLWVAGGSDHVYDYDRKNRKLRGIPGEKQGVGTPSSLIRLHDGKILAISRLGFYELRDDQLVYLPIFEELAASRVGFETPYQDENGYLWLGSLWGGLYKMDLEREEYRDYVEGMGFHGIPNIFLDRDNNIWAGWRSNGGFLVYHAQKDTVFQFPYQPGTQETIYYPRGFEQDKEGNVWMSDIRVGGLMQINPSRLEEGIRERYIGSSGTFNNYMRSLKSDEKGRIWAVTKEGLQVFDPKNKTFKLFGESVGFRLRAKNRLWSNFVPPYLTRLSTGEMLVGHTDGFAIFHPDSLKDNDELPIPYFLMINANRKKLITGVSFGQSTTVYLKHDQNLLEFEFSCIAYNEPNRIRYAYRLKGLDEQWIHTIHREIQYAGLPPGEYSFQLRAANCAGDFQKNPLEFHFRILPPWWATWWAYLGYLLLAGAATFAFYYYKKRQWQLKANLVLKQQEAERLKEIDTAKTNLYTNITHEFRTPLTIILGMVDQIKNNPKEWYSEGLQVIKHSGKNLLRLINQMLELSKSEAGVLPVNIIQGDVIAFLKYVQESFHSLAKNKNIRLQFQSELPELQMDYDPEKLREIISNLISNAIKFTPEEGIVQLKVQQLAGGSNTNSTHLIVKDSGNGISSEKLPHIFDRFYQADENTGTLAGGTGIGLALTKELVKLLGGSISVKSEVGKGTTFSVILPVKRVATQSAVPQKDGKFVPLLPTEIQPRPEAETTGGKILIVEDNADLVVYLKSILDGDYQLVVTNNGREGIEKAIETIPDLIISDVMMPEANGFELCETLKKDERTSHIPIILLTAKADVASKIEGLNIGADAYLAKPFEREELLVRLKKLIELRQLLQKHYHHISVLDPLAEGQYQIEDIFMQKFFRTIDENLSDENFNVGRLCISMGMSRTQLYLKISALTDLPLANHLRRRRMKRAKLLLLETNHTVSEVAYQVGFKDPSFFSRCFKKEFGVSPSKIRR